MFRIPTPDKKFVVDNASMSRGNIHATFNVMFDADRGRIKLNPLVKLWKSTADSADFVKPTAIVVASKNGGGGGDAYIMTTKSSGFGGIWSTTDWGKLTGANAPATCRDGFSDACLCWGYLHVSDTDGLHYVLPDASAGDWAIKDADADWKGHFILLPFIETGRLYMISTYKIISCDSSYTRATSGSYTQIGLTTTITAARASSKRIWYATQSPNGYGDCKIYEWDGVSPNPLNIHTIPVSKIQNIFIIDDVPVAIDQRGRFWFYDGCGFSLKDGVNIPAREDDFALQTVSIHRNGSFVDKGKAYILVGSGADTKNTTERALAGIWCYDPSIGLYHHSSPDNTSQIPLTLVYALARGLYDGTMIAGYGGGQVNTTSVDKISVTEQTGIAGTSRVGFIITQFLESKNLQDMFSSIGVRFRKMFDPEAKIEVKYRLWKSIECNTTITWTGARTFTATVSSLNGTSVYCTPVKIGDEVMIQNGANTGISSLR